MKKRPVTTPRVKFSFATKEARNTALQKVHDEYPQLMTSVVEDHDAFYLFVQSVRSFFFDSQVRHLVESAGGKYLTEIS